MARRHPRVHGTAHHTPPRQPRPTSPKVGVTRASPASRKSPNIGPPGRRQIAPTSARASRISRNVRRPEATFDPLGIHLRGRCKSRGRITTLGMEWRRRWRGHLRESGRSGLEATRLRRDTPPFLALAGPGRSQTRAESCVHTPSCPTTPCPPGARRLPGRYNR